MSQVITGTFRDAAEANEAVDELIASGYDRNDISVIMNNDVREQNFGSGTHLDAHNDDAGARVAKGAAGGSAIGGTIGAIVGAFLLTGAVGATAATGGIAAPFIAGPLAAALAGGGAGAAAGSLVGAIAAAGVPHDRAERLQHDVEGGAIVVAVRAQEGDEPEVRRILRESSDATATTAGTNW